MRGLVARILLSLTGAGWLLLSASAARTEEPSSPSPADAQTAQQITLLVKQLGNDDCRAREAASEQLTKLGMSTLPALTAALEHPDLEVRIRAKQVLFTVIAADFQRRLKEFAADVNDERGLDLPYWKQFKQAVGHDAPARELFVAMQREEAPLLSVADLGAQAAAEGLQQRYLALQSRPVLSSSNPANRKGLPFESVAALILVASDPDVKLPDGVANTFGNLPNLPSFRQDLLNGGEDGLSRRIFKRWVAHPGGAKTNTVALQNMSLANQLNMPESITPALQILAAQIPAPYYRQQAMLIIGRFGKAEHLAVLEPFLQDTIVCGKMAVASAGSTAPVDIQIRDVTLAVMLHLSGQDPKDYGYTNIQANEQTLYNQQTLGFLGDAQRDAALKKWKDWLEAQKAEAQKAKKK